MSAGAVPYIQANTNGRLHPAEEPSVSPLNRGFLYGDAVYEVWRTYHGAIFAWDEHWRRLLGSAAALELVLPWTAEEMLAEIRRTAAAFRERTGRAGELYIRLQVTRGGGRIGLDPALADRPDYVLLVQPCPELTPAQAEHGLRLVIARQTRRNPAAALDPAWKTGNYLNNLLALREARRRGGDEVVILNLAGEITEAAVCNLAWIRGEGSAAVLATPPLSVGILSGITRGLVLGGVAARAGLAVAETVLRPEDLPAYRECLLLSSTRDVVPVAAVDECAFAIGPSTAGARLKRAFADYAAEQAAAHPERRV